MMFAFVNLAKQILQNEGKGGLCFFSLIYVEYPQLKSQSQSFKINEKRYIHMHFRHIFPV